MESYCLKVQSHPLNQPGHKAVVLTATPPCRGGLGEDEAGDTHRTHVSPTTRSSSR